MELDPRIRKLLSDLQRGATRRKEQQEWYESRPRYGFQQETRLPFNGAMPADAKPVTGSILTGEQQELCRENIRRCKEYRDWMRTHPAEHARIMQRCQLTALSGDYGSKNRARKALAESVPGRGHADRIHDQRRQRERGERGSMGTAFRAAYSRRMP